MSYNEITGLLQYEPELRFTNSGIELCTFRLQIDDGFVSCNAWRNVGSAIVELNLKAGQEICVAGSWKSRVLNHQDGRQHTIREFNVTEYKVL